LSYNRRGLAPWSIDREAGVESATVDSKIDVTQLVRPTLDVGFIDEKGKWKGLKSSDKEFIAYQKDEGIPNSGEILTPSSNADGTWPLDMTGYQDLIIAIKPSNGGNVSIQAVMGPDSVSFANLSPVNAAAGLKGKPAAEVGSSLLTLFLDSSESLTADVWNIFIIQNQLRNQKLLQFKITNNSGGNSDIECTFMRMV
jgi:hypothetical protein